MYVCISAFLNSLVLLVGVARLQYSAIAIAQPCVSQIHLNGDNTPLRIDSILLEYMEWCCVGFGRTESTLLCISEFWNLRTFLLGV